MICHAGNETLTDGVKVLNVHVREKNSTLNYLRTPNEQLKYISILR
jgi:hypothetical protein